MSEAFKEKTQTWFSRERVYLLSLFLFLFALAPRFLLTRTARFTGDEAMFWDISKQIVDGQSAPVLGHPISGGKASHPGSAFYYLMAVSQLFTATPESANIFVAVLNSLAVVAYWLALRMIFGEVPALMASLMFSCSPWNLLAADRIWASNVVDVLVVFAFLAAIKVRQRPDSPWISLLVVFAGILPQFHLTAPIVWISLAVLVFPNRKQLNIRYVLIGILFLLLAYAPYLLSEISTGFQNLSAYVAESGVKVFNYNFLRVPLYGFRFLTLDISFHELRGYWSLYRESQAILAMFFGVAEHSFSLVRLFFCLSSFALAGWALKVMFEKTHGSRDELSDFRKCILFGFGLNMLLLGITKKNFYAHYSLPLIPFVFIVYGQLFQSLERRSKKAVLACLGSLMFMWGGIETAITLSRGVDFRNSLVFERKVLDEIMANRKNESVKEVGLEFAFDGGNLLAYETLAKRVYGRDLRFVTNSVGVNYIVAVKNDGTPFIKEKLKYKAGEP